MNFAKTIKMTALAGLSAIAFAGFTAPASAHQSYVRCDRDGDRCVRVVCDRDGDDCRRIAYYNNDRGRRYRDYDRGHRELVCNRRGRDCHYVWVGGRGDYRGRDGAYFGLSIH